MTAGDFDLSPIEVLTFDCYGTLIDWETGILAGLREVIGDEAGVSDGALLESYAAAEAAVEAGPWRPYRAVLAEALRVVCRPLGIQPTVGQAAAFGASVADWPAFPDSAAALARLAGRFELGVVTNCDDDLFAASDRRLGEPFAWVVTAEQVRSYKPAPRHFEVALERSGRQRWAVLHVAQSLYHDHVPARALGLATAWVDRRRGKSGPGATPLADVAPDIVVPDIASLAHLALAR